LKRVTIAVPQAAIFFAHWILNMKDFLIAPDFTLEQLWSDSTLCLGILASGSGSNVEAIAQSIATRQLNAEIPLLIYNNPNAKVTERCQRLHIPCQLLNHRDYAHREDLDRAIVKAFRQQGVDWVIMAGWMRIVTPVLLDAFSDHVLNIHPSLLPSFRGIRAVEQALAAGVKITGCTVHFASLEVDSGQIVVQSSVPVLPNDTATSLHARIQIQEHRIFPLGIALAAQGSRAIAHA
jgi:phosphoribosylglycinamide formyltransferase-1